MLSLQSPAFQNGASIPSQYTCEGDNISPPLNWQGVPAEAKSLVLIIDDPDAPDPSAPRMVWSHWLVYNIPCDTNGLPAAVTPGQLPAGCKQGTNDWQKTAYGGPCPPIGRHRYFHKLYALDTGLALSGRVNKSKIENAIKDHVIASAQLVGTYEKSR
ncbi:MAG: YbhB/YbcL family Raf kinase inhibitor-like protein [Gammaproteobacteria bacterium]|nr:YbhB/YbcL family Raf kinase inhibitor-like protein [Gammaproteobacteria bacterium]